VPDDVLVERVVGRRLDPVTGKIYHVVFSPPPAELVPRLTVRSDDTEEKARNRLAVHARNVDAVRGMYSSTLTRVDGNRDKNAVFADLSAAIAELR
jgi:adenylate kinase